MDGGEALVVSALWVTVPQWVTKMKQYKLPGGHKEIGETLQELEKVGIIKPNYSHFI